MKQQINHHLPITNNRAVFDTRTDGRAGARVLPFNPFPPFEPNV